MKALVVALLVVASAGPARAQEVREVITATGDVHDLATLGDRTLVATSGGLAVWQDDRVARVIGAHDGLPGARLRSVSITEDGVWVGGVEGTALLDRETLAVLRTLPLRRVRRAARFGGTTWLASYGSGLHRIAADGGIERVTLGSHHTLARVTDLEVHEGALWVATAGSGVLQVDATGRVRARVRSGLPDAMVWDLASDGDRLLVATLGGVGVVRGGAVERRARETLASSRLPIRDVRSIAREGDGLSLATWGGGVHRILPGRARAVPALGVAAQHARVVSGSFVGHAGGLAQLDERGRLRALEGMGLPSADVSALASAFGALWVGTFDRGLARVRNGRAEPELRASERWGVDRRVNDLAVTRDRRGRETLWIATDRGLFQHDGRRFSPALDPRAPAREHVTSLHVDREGALWVTSSRQLTRMRDGRWDAWTGDARMPVMQLHAVTTDAEGRVWVGSLHGLYRFDARRGSFERHTTSSGALPVDWVTAVLPWGDGVVAGTYHGGLAWYDGRGFRIEREGRAGVPAGWVNPHAMRWIGGRLWIGTLERGLVVGESGAWTHLRVDDGLPSDDVTDILPAGDGTAWVATRGGIARVTL